MSFMLIQKIVLIVVMIGTVLALYWCIMELVQAVRETENSDYAGEPWIVSKPIKSDLYKYYDEFYFHGRGEPLFSLTFKEE